MSASRNELASANGNFRIQPDTSAQNSAFAFVIADGDAPSNDPDLIGTSDRGPGSAALRALRQAQLYEITNADTSVMAGAILTLVVAACVAGLIPARRAASIEPQA